MQNYNYDYKNYNYKNYNKNYNYGILTSAASATLSMMVNNKGLTTVGWILATFFKPYTAKLLTMGDKVFLEMILDKTLTDSMCPEVLKKNYTWHVITHVMLQQKQDRQEVTIKLHSFSIC